MKILATVLLLVVSFFGQVVHTFPAAETDNLWTGGNRFNKSLVLGEASCTAGAAGVAILCTDATHQLRKSLNGSGLLNLVGIASPGVAGRCPQFATNGIDLVDSGTTCGGGGGGSTPGTPLNSFQWNSTGSLAGAIGHSYTPGTGTNPGVVNADNINGVVTVTSDYDFQACALSCSFTITGAATISVGSNTITLTPVPIGINGTNDPHYLQITPAGGDPSPIEWVKIAGGTAVSGAASGTLTFTAAYSHSANYKLQSATNGIQEAANSFTPPGVMLKLIPGKIYTCNAPIFLPGQNDSLDGQWARIVHNSFSSCVVLGQQTGLWGTSSTNISFELSRVDMRPGQTLWTATPIGSITGANPTESVTVATCPAGFFANIPDQLLWLAGTANGKPTTVYGYGEYVMTVSGTCAPGVSNGTVVIKQVTPNVTNIAAHDNGYTISNGVGPFIEDSLGLNGHIHDIRFASSQSGTLIGGNMIQVDNDQACGIDNVDMSAGFVTRKDATFQSAGIFAPGAFSSNAAICDLGPNVNISEPSSCVKWFSGNDFSWTGGICQNYTAGGVIVGGKRGGFGKFTIGPNVHFENGSLVPIWGAGNVVGDPSVLIISSNKPADISSDLGQPTLSAGNGSPFPLYLNIAAQSNTQYYYLVAHNNTLTGCTSGGDCISAPIFMGEAVVDDPSVNNVPFKFFGWGAGAPATPSQDVSTYDLLRVTASSGAINTNIPQPPTATANIAVATGLAPSAICSTMNICTITDNVAPGSLAGYTPNYRFTSTKRFYPLAMLLPGAVALSAIGSANLTSTPSTVRAKPTCLNSMEYLGSQYVGEFTNRSYGSESDVGSTCPNTLGPIANFGGGTNCVSSAGTCGRAKTGSVTIAAGATTVTVNTSGVMQWSTFQVTENATRGSLLGVTCNTTLGRTYMVTAAAYGTSFTITTSAAPVATPACLDYVVN